MLLPPREELGGLGHEPLGEGRKRIANPAELRPRRGLAQLQLSDVLENLIKLEDTR